MKITKAVFPLAGLGTRLLPITKSIPKEMIPVGDKPLLHYAVEEALSSGITDLIFIVRDQKNMIRRYFDRIEIKKNIEPCYRRIKELNLLISKIRSIKFIKQEKPLGLGHAVFCAKNIVGNEPFAVLLADDLIKSKTPVTSQMIQHFQKLDSSIIAISIINHDHVSNYGILSEHRPIYDGITRIISLVEKPPLLGAPSNLAVTGRYILTPDIFNTLETLNTEHRKEIQLTDAITKLLKQQPVYGYYYQGNRFDCGSKTGLQIANAASAMNNPNVKRQLTPFLQKSLKT